MRNLHLVFTVLTASLLASCASPDRRAEVAVPPVSPVASPIPVAPPVVPAADPRQVQLSQLQRLAPDADPGVLALALEARACAVRNGAADASARLAVIARRGIIGSQS